jgi:hypothetical protein
MLKHFPLRVIIVFIASVMVPYDSPIFNTRRDKSELVLLYIIAYVFPL